MNEMPSAASLSPWTTFVRHYVRDIVYAANDGIVTTFAVVAGVQGAKLSPWIVLALGFANLAADGLSMAAGNYLGIKSERATELGNDYAERVETLHAAKHAAVTWGFFTLAGMAPLIPYLLFGQIASPFPAAVVCAALSLFTVGAIRTKVTGRLWWQSGLEMLLVGAFAGFVAFASGAIVARLMDEGARQALLAPPPIQLL